MDGGERPTVRIANINTPEDIPLGHSTSTTRSNNMTVYYKEEPRFVDIPDSMEELEEEIKRSIGTGDITQWEKEKRVINIFVTLYRDNRFKDIESLLPIHFPEMEIKTTLSRLGETVRGMLSNPDYDYDRAA